MNDYQDTMQTLQHILHEQMNLRQTLETVLLVPELRQAYLCFWVQKVHWLFL